MIRTGRRAWAFALAVTMASPARAARPFATAPYLKTCDGFLAAVEADGVEAFLMNQAQTPAERGQLLLDLGLVFTPEYQRAVRAALLKRTFGTTGRRARGLVLRAITRVPGEGKRFAEETLHELEAILAEGTSTEARIMRARLVRVRATIARSPHRAEWLHVYAAALRGTIAATMVARIKARGDTFENVPMFVGLGSVSGFVGTEIFVFSAPQTIGHALFLGIIGAVGGSLFGLMSDLLNDVLRAVTPTPRVPGPWRSGNREFSATALDADATGNGRPRSLEHIHPNDLRGHSPVHLAFAGELELAGLYDIAATGEALDQRAVEHDLARLRERGRDLERDWSDSRARVRYAAAVNDLVQLIGKVERVQARRLETGRTLLKDIREHLERIGRVSIDVTSDQLNDERVLKQELLINRRRVGLRALAAIEIDERPGRELLEALSPLVRDLKQALEPTPSSDEDWRRVVERVDEACARVHATLASIEGVGA